MATITIHSSTGEIQDFLRKQAYQRYQKELSKQSVPCKPFSPTTEAPDLQGRVSPDFLDEHTEVIFAILFLGLGAVFSIYITNKAEKSLKRSALVSEKKTLVSFKESHQKLYNGYAEQKKTYTDELAKLRKDEAREEDRMKEARLNYKIKFCESMMNYHQERIAKYESKMAQVNKALETIGN